MNRNESPWTSMIHINCIFTRDVFPRIRRQVTIFRTFVIPKRDQLANNSLSREIRVWINIADISNDINAFGVAYPISASIWTLLLFLKRMIDSCRDQVQRKFVRIDYSLRVYSSNFSNEYQHPISISKTRKYLKLFFEKIETQNIPYRMINEIDKAFLFFLPFFFLYNYWKIPFLWIPREDWANMIPR